MDAGRILSNQNNEINELPFGYKFHPTPFEVLQYYLVPKLKGEPLPSGYVKDLDVYQFDPDQIPLNESMYARDDEAYFFVPVTKKHLQGEGNLTRATPSGCWRSYKKNIPLYTRDGSAIGYKNKLEFYNGKDPINGVKTNWRMVEYRTNFRVNGNSESCMVCKVNLKVKVEEIPDEEDGAMSGDESREADK
ncbi:nac transcription factor 25 [Phtheirospermum japonicum]|uniref:Nac transcription factor 25 n=1 Tax=Phtheirospermum japonicum TaxID=374723 RepID=A0A830D4M2_9LAMI|nr:nac transcription factor 25 [Phtheirospermum japonicum]